MLSFSHIDVANHFYKKLKQDQLNFTLNKRAFLKGNILPDKQRHLFNAHFWDESKTDYESYLVKANDRQLNSIQRSEALGVVCHFMCDYFCKYHTIPKYKEIQDYRHFMYEAMLHIKMKFIMIKRNLIGVKLTEEAIFSGLNLANMVGKNGELDSLIDVYRKSEESLITDLTFQFAAVRATLIRILNANEIELKEPLYEGLLLGFPIPCEIEW